MNNMKRDKFFLLIGFKNIKLIVLNENNEILLNKEILINDTSLQENFKTLENFLDKNILDLEKKLNNYIKEINLIINYDDFFAVDLSSTQNFSNYSEGSEKVSNSLLNIKNNVIQNMPGYDLIHMIINQFIIDGKVYSFVPKDYEFHNLSFEIRFIWLKNNILKNFKKIFSKYQILIKNVSSYEYVNSFKNPLEENIFDLADKLANGLNQKEVLLNSNSSKNIGFFEKFCILP